MPVLVASDRVTNLGGLSGLLSPAEGFLVIDTRECPDRLMLQCAHMAPCVLIIDADKVRALDPKEFADVTDYGRAVKIIVAGAAAGDRSAYDLIKLGCMGFVPEPVSAPELKRAVSAVIRGEFWFQRRVLASVVQRLLFEINSPKLTPREREILKLIAAGYKNRAIAEHLAISNETVRWHIRSLHAKLGFQDRLETALYARQFLSEDVPAAPSEHNPPKFVPGRAEAH